MVIESEMDKGIGSLMGTDGQDERVLVDRARGTDI